MKIRYRPRALADIEDIYEYLESRSPSGARNVIAAVHGSIRSNAISRMRRNHGRPKRARTDGQALPIPSFLQDP
jgi:plasmid stabilization system protein ParE